MLKELCLDLAQEQASLDAVVAPLAADEWAVPTPAAGWDVRDSLSHLCFFDETATLALTEPAAFERQREERHGEFVRGQGPDVALGRHLDDPRELLARWRSARRALLDALTKVDPEARVPWYGVSMGAVSFTTARLMETWAHGVDIHDALSLPLLPSHRLQHVCHLGYSARAYTFRSHGVEDPGDAVRLVVQAPDGSEWHWGPEGADESIAGRALDVALVFTQRRHPEHAEVAAMGAVATQWLAIAQAFAGRGTTTAIDRV